MRTLAENIYSLILQAMNINFLSLLWWFALSAGLTFLLTETLQLAPILCWFAGVNISAFLSMGKDKASAKASLARTPEATLLILGLAGGFPGILAGRKFFNHKTTKKAFIIPMWLLFALQLFSVAYFFDTLETLGFKKQPPEFKSSVDTQK